MTTCKRCYYSREHCICKGGQADAAVPPAVQPTPTQPNASSSSSSLGLFRLVEIPHLECVLCLKRLPPGPSQRIERKRHGQVHEREGLVTAHQDMNDPLCVSFF